MLCFRLVTEREKSTGKVPA